MEASVLSDLNAMNRTLAARTEHLRAANARIAREPFRLIFTVWAGVVMALLLPLAALAEGARKFTLVNHTGVEMTELYASPTTADSWEEDILDGEGLPHLGVQTFTVEDGRDHCAYDIRAVFADGEELTDAVDVCHAEVMEMIDVPEEDEEAPARQSI